MVCHFEGVGEKLVKRTSGPKKKLLEGGENCVWRDFKVPLLAGIARMVKSKRVGWTGHVARTHATEEIYLQVRKI